MEHAPFNMNDKLRWKYRSSGGPKSIKNTKAGNGKREGAKGKISWKAGTGQGNKK